MSVAGAPRVLVAGFPAELAAFLARRLPGASVRAADASSVRAELARGGWSLLVLHDDGGGAGARDLLGALAGRPPAFLSLPGGSPGVTRHDLEALGIARVFLPPLDRESLVREAAALLALAPAAEAGGGDGKRAELGGAVAKAWERFRNVILARVDTLAAAAAALAEGTLDGEGRRHAEREAHKLAGSAGTFGFAHASRVARDAERLLEGSAPLAAAEALRLAGLVADLRAELATPPGAAPEPVAERPEPTPAPADPRPLVLVVDEDEELAGRVAAEAAGRGMRTRVALSIGQARAAVAEESPAAVVQALAFESGESGLELLAELSSRTPRVPVVVVTERRSLTDRVDVARLGGLGYLQKPVPPTAIVDAVEGALQRGAHDRTSVLVVDDDPVVLAETQRLLAAAGVTVHTLNEPLRLWDALEEQSPDVVVLDIDMPRVNGIELCRVMRNDPRWSATPVVFLTARTARETVQEVFAAGADDFVTKPIVGPELVTRITNRLERVQLHRALADTDPLTGVANRRRSEEMMGQLMHVAVRQNQPFSLAIIDIDHFKRINDRFGHGTGDEVLRRVARQLERSFRAEDVVARWGGEEFVVGMFGMEKEDGVQRMAEVLEAMREEPFDVPGADHPVRVTFSGGVAQHWRDGTDLPSLYRAADAALYQAKETGRDRMLPAGWTPDVSDDAEGVDVLVVEGDEVLARRLLRALDTRGYRSRWLPDGAQAAAELIGSRGRPRARVVLLDVDLPGVDVHAVLRALGRERAERTRVIVLTARADEAEAATAMDAGAFDHVAKPFLVPSLLKRIRRAIRA